MIQFKWKLPTAGYLIPTAALFAILYVIGNQSADTDIFVMIISPLMSTIFALPLSSYSYRVVATHNDETDQLHITYIKFYCTIHEHHQINRNGRWVLKSIQNPSFVRAAMYHTIDIGDQKLRFIPISCVSFSLANKIMELLHPSQLFIDRITRTNAAAVLPSAKMTPLDIPKQGVPGGYFALQNGIKLLDLHGFKQKRPTTGIFNALKPLVLGGIILLFPPIIFGLLLASTFGIVEAVPFDTGVFLLFIGIVLLGFGIVITGNVITILLGKLSLNINENYINISYKFWKREFVINIHRAFNPLFQIRDGDIFLVILGNDTRIFYEHRLGTAPRREIDKDLSSLAIKTSL